MAMDRMEFIMRLRDAAAMLNEASHIYDTDKKSRRNVRRLIKKARAGIHGLDTVWIDEPLRIIQD